MMRDGETGEWTVQPLRAALALVLGVALSLFSSQAPPWAQDLVHQVGFALLVAVVIWVTFHFLSEGDQEERWRRRVEQITNRTFHAALRRDLPKELLAEAHRLILDQVFVHRNLSLEYVLEDATYTNTQGVAGPYVKASVALRFTIVNISDVPQSCPVAVSLSNPLHPGLKDRCDVLSATLVQHGQRRDLEISGPRARFRLAMARSTAAHATCHCGDIDLAAGEQADVDLRYVVAKQEQDSDRFDILYPSDSIRLMVVDRGPEERRIGANAHHPGELEDQTLTPDGGPYQFRLNRYLLPHQGVTVWWKKASPGLQPS